MLTAFVLARHGYPERARILADGLLALGEDDDDVRLAGAVLRFLEKDYVGAMGGLDHLDAAPARADTRETVRMRRYLRARCYCEIGQRLEGERIARALLVD